MLVYVVMETFVGRSTQPPSHLYRRCLLFDIFFYFIHRNQGTPSGIKPGSTTGRKFPKQTSWTCYEGVKKKEFHRVQNCSKSTTTARRHARPPHTFTDNSTTHHRHVTSSRSGAPREEKQCRFQHSPFSPHPIPCYSARFHL